MRVQYSVDSHIATITLDDPKTRNALSDALLDQLIGAVRTAGEDDQVRVLVLTSSHETIFSAGGDLKAFASDDPIIRKYENLDRFPTLYQLLGSVGKPVLCAANGDVLAGSFGIALACDLVIAKDTVKFGCPEINVGVFPFMISALIYRNVPRMVANRLMMLGDSITAAEAKEYGFVNEVVSADAFESTVSDWAQRLASKSPLLMRLGKNALNATRDSTLPEALGTLQSQLALAFSTEDMREGVAAFMEKRPPEWKMQ